MVILRQRDSGCRLGNPEYRLFSTLNIKVGFNLYFNLYLKLVLAFVFCLHILNNKVDTGPTLSLQAIELGIVSAFAPTNT